MPQPLRSDVPTAPSDAGGVGVVVDDGRLAGGVLSAPTLKLRHVQVCLQHQVEYTSRTTGLERYDLPYVALPETDLTRIDTRTTFLGHDLRAPVLIGAMTGGMELASTINRNLAVAAQHLGLGLMLGSQRVMLEHPDARSSFQVRDHAPDVLLVGNLGLAQLNRGYTAVQARQVVDLVGADALAFHTNPLQEAVQTGGDGDFGGLVGRLAEVTAQLSFPVMLKEVGHGLGTVAAQRLAGATLAAVDVAGAGGTSWARVEQYVAHGEVRNPQLAEWGIPTAQALREVRAVLPATPLVASGGIRTGLDAAKALALGASMVAMALPLLEPATRSPEAVVAWLENFLWELRVAMHCSGAGRLADLRHVELQLAELRTGR